MTKKSPHKAGLSTSPAQAEASRRTRGFRRFGGRIARFFSREDGNPTVEFVLVFPVFMMLIASSCETGLLLVRQMMLQHGVELSARAIRLGTSNEVTDDDIRQMVCEGAGIIPDCLSSTKVEMIRVDPMNWQAPPDVPDCVDRNEPAQPNRTFEHGIGHEIMFVRVCVLFDPLMPNFGHGVQLTAANGDHYALVASTMFVMEPSL